MTAADQRASGAVPTLLLVELQFVGGTQRLTTWSHAVDLLGYTWQALGSLVSVGRMVQSDTLQYPALELTLNVGNPAHLALALGAPAQYRRRPITVWECELDDELRPYAEPELVWAGLMDQVRVKTGDGEKEQGSVTLRCELPGRDNRQATGLRLNHAQHIARHPGDTGLSRIEQITGQPRTWLTKRFQRV